jgi:hypothetical protein
MEWSGRKRLFGKEQEGRKLALWMEERGREEWKPTPTSLSLSLISSCPGWSGGGCISRRSDTAARCVPLFVGFGSAAAMMNGRFQARVPEAKLQEEGETEMQPPALSTRV